MEITDEPVSYFLSTAPRHARGRFMLTPFPTHLYYPPTFLARTTSDKWQKRFFVAKDGFLLYYSEGKVAQSFFDTKPKVRLLLLCVVARRAHGGTVTV